ncbi:unnamed protein product [Trichogramma brassicae]|uniref:Uncharacterized protein n=1 Tax=Trichogramma brassicae TaxID=86971 RepID=A0A6H5J1N0_9HYME|nr:unnamed protein product [Trichogramma brassicae]
MPKPPSPREVMPNGGPAGAETRTSRFEPITCSSSWRALFVCCNNAYGRYLKQSVSTIKRLCVTIIHELLPQIAACLQRLDTKLVNLTTHVLTTEASLSRLEGRIGALETRSEQQAAEIAEIRADIVGIKKTANSVPDAAPAPVLPGSWPHYLHRLARICRTRVRFYSLDSQQM